QTKASQERDRVPLRGDDRAGERAEDHHRGGAGRLGWRGRAVARAVHDLARAVMVTNAPRSHVTARRCFMAHGTAQVKVGLWVHLVAKPGKEEDLASFLASALPLAQAEPATTAWFAVRMGRSSFGIFDVFPDEAGRAAHVGGPIAAALGTRGAELL